MREYTLPREWAIPPSGLSIPFPARRREGFVFGRRAARYAQSHSGANQSRRRAVAGFPFPAVWILRAESAIRHPSP